MTSKDLSAAKLNALVSKIIGTSENILANQESQYFQDASKTKDNLLVQSMMDDINARKNYTPRIFALMCSWIGFVIVILLLQGFGAKCEWFKLSDLVLTTFIGGTTANILGLWIFVIKYLYKPIKN